MAVSTARIFAHRNSRLNSFSGCNACGDDVRRGTHCDTCTLDLKLRARRREDALARLWFCVGAMPTWRAVR